MLLDIAIKLLGQKGHITSAVKKNIVYNKATISTLRATLVFYRKNQCGGY